MNRHYQSNSLVIGIIVVSQLLANIVHAAGTTAESNNPVTLSGDDIRSCESIMKKTMPVASPEKSSAVVSPPEPTVHEMMDEIMKPAAGSRAETEHAPAPRIGTAVEMMHGYQEALVAIGPFPSVISYGSDVSKDPILNQKAKLKVADCAGRLYSHLTAVQKITDLAEGQKNSSEPLQQSIAEARKDFVEIAHQTVYDQSQFSLYLGPSLSLNRANGVKTSLEALVLYDGGAGSLLNRGRWFSEVQYRSLNEVKTADFGQPASPGATAQSLFKSDKGYFRWNIGASTNLTTRYSAALTAGATALPGVGAGDSEPLRPRIALTGLARTFVSDNLYLRFSTGYAYDKYWVYDVAASATDVTAGTIRHRAYDRYTADALLQLHSNAIPGGISATTRLSLDTPLGGKGPSEVRLSVLAYVTFNDFFKALNPIFQP